jgi:hypothetical protein
MKTTSKTKKGTCPVRLEVTPILQYKEIASFSELASGEGNSIC